MEALAQLLIGIGFIAIFVNYMKNGPVGVKSWWRAKFKGQPA